MASSLEEDVTLQLPTYPMPFSELLDELDLLSLIDV